MAFKACSSLLAWLLATTTTMTLLVSRKVAATTSSSECAEVAACEADAVCGECLTVGSSFDKVYEDCMASVTTLTTCYLDLKTACCQSLASANDCLANDFFVEAWWCIHKDSSCPWPYPNLEACESITLDMTAGGVSNSGAAESPAPTEAAVVPATTAAPVAASTDAPVAPPVAAATAAPVAPPVAAPPTGAPVAPPAAAPPTAPAPVGTVEAGEVTTVTVSANAFDGRTDADGCPPDGCTAGNTRDGDLTAVSRWSCSGDLVAAAGGAAGEECQILYEFSEAQDVPSVAVAFWKGDTRTRALNINVNGALHTAVESSGTTAGLETFELVGAEGVLSLGLESSGLASDEFLSIIEAEFQVSDGVVSPPTTAAPAASRTPAPSAAVTSAPVGVVTSPPTAAPAAVTTPAPIAQAATTPAPIAQAATTPAPIAQAATTPAPIAQAATTPAPTATSSSSRGVELTTPSPTEGTAVESGGASTSSVYDVSNVYLDAECAVLPCLDDEVCAECVTLAAEDEAEHDACLQAGSGGGACDSFFTAVCCTATVSGHDCTAVEGYSDFLSCLNEQYYGSDACSTDDIECAALGDFGIDDSGSGVAGASIFSTAILTGALGLAGVVAVAAEL